MAKSLADQVLPKSVKDGVLRTIDPFLRRRANGKGVCSGKMRHERQQFIVLMVAQLWQLGFRIRKVESLAGKHVRALMAYWHSQGIVPGTLHTRLSMVNVLCDWLGKTNVVQDITCYLPSHEVRRNTVCTESKAWDVKAIDPIEVIHTASQVDERLAVMLALQHYFGLRVKESIEIRPENAVVENGQVLQIHEGTKGGRVRRIPIRTPEQREVMEWARRVAAQGNTKRLRWTDCRSWPKAQNRYYNLVRRRLGVSRKMFGVTSHGLRHGYAQRGYERESGLPSPIKGGALGLIDRETHRTASMTVSHDLGHGRIDVTTGYYGSYGHALRGAPPAPMTPRFGGAYAGPVALTYSAKLGIPGGPLAKAAEGGETPPTETAAA